MTVVPRRLHWFSALVPASRDDRVLEVGCGNGMLLALLAQRHPHTTLVGIDRSALQVRKATLRLAVLPTPPPVYKRELEALDAPLAAAPFSRIVAMNLNLVWTQPAGAGIGLRALLTPRGRVFLGFEPPTAGGRAGFKARLARAATAAGFAQVSVHNDRASSAFAVEWRRLPSRARPRTA